MYHDIHDVINIGTSKIGEVLSNKNRPLVPEMVTNASETVDKMARTSGMSKAFGLGLCSSPLCILERVNFRKFCWNLMQTGHVPSSCFLVLPLLARTSLYYFLFPFLRPLYLPPSPSIHLTVSFLDTRFRLIKLYSQEQLKANPAARRSCAV